MDAEIKNEIRINCLNAITSTLEPYQLEDKNYAEILKTLSLQLAVKSIIYEQPK